MRVLSLLFLLLMCFAANCVPTPALAAPVSIVADSNGGEDSDGDQIFPTIRSDERECDPDDLDPHALGLRHVYLDHVRFRGAAGASIPQIDDFGYPRGFEARGPPTA